jgi:hypothetical protein
MAHRLVGIGLVVATLAVLTGCGGRAEKGINQDKDRPRTADTRK